MGRKNLFLVALALLCSVSAFAQGAGRYKRPDSSRFLITNDQYLGIRLGYNSSTLSLSGCNGVDASGINGMNIGLVYGVNLTEQAPVYLETGLLYSGKGSNLRRGEDRYSVRMHNLELPLVIKYKIDTQADELSIQPFGGAFMAMGVGGRFKSYSDRMSYATFHSGSFQNFDIGFRLGCGLQYNVFYAELSYDIGMADMASSDASNLAKHLNYDDFDDNIRTGNLSLTVGVNF